MNAPQKEVEVDLKELGCPYPLLDLRADAWIAGYRAGLNSGRDIALRALGDELADCAEPAPFGPGRMA